jgi:glyoxylase-like metal-dependent hydrolase (beta-lactamase superfamily II)
MGWHDLQNVGRRTWLARSAGGLLAAWTALDFGFGRQGWGVLLGVPRPAAAQEPAAQILRVQTDVNLPPNSGLGLSRIDVSAYVLVRGSEAALVDTLTPGNAQHIGNVIQSFGLDWDAVRHVILTHYHGDHAGSVGDLAGLAPAATVWAGPADIPRIELARGIKPANDGDEVFGLRIVATPGHTAGHISIYDPAGSAMILGDAVNNLGGQFGGSPPQFTADMAQAADSIKKLGAIGFERGLFAHGPPITGGASAAIATLAGG